MDLLRRLFGGRSGGAREAGDPDGLYFYVRPDGCDEVVRVRVHRHNDLSLMDSEGGERYWVHKLVRGAKCFTSTAELDLYFNARRQLESTEVKNGALVTEADYQAWVASQEGSSA